jgi:SHS2 domain-containing protein
MSDLSQIIKSVQDVAAEASAECLEDQITEDVASLGDLIVRLEQASTGRQSRRNGEMEYIDASSEVLATVLNIALFLRELTERPVLWAHEACPN